MRKRKTTITNPDNAMYVNAVTLAAMLECGRATADKIGTAAGARVKFGAAVRYSVKKVNAYLEELAEKGA